jgi:hypothetical protein
LREDRKERLEEAKREIEGRYEEIWKVEQGEYEEKMKRRAAKEAETGKKVGGSRRAPLQWKYLGRCKPGSRIGDLVEEMIAPNILEKLNKLGYVFGKVALNVRYTDSRGQDVAEVDMLQENGDTALVVEVKTNLTHDDVRDPRGADGGEAAALRGRTRGQAEADRGDSGRGGKGLCGKGGIFRAGTIRGHHKGRRASVVKSFICLFSVCRLPEAPSVNRP